jgi:hypothetical protein
MPYSLKPHRHVKICLCHSDETFLELPRQLLLQHLRLINPRDTIYFVYDRELFAKDPQQREAILQQLDSFCLKNNIRPFDVRRNLSLKSFSQDEKKLFCLYEEEINHLNEGGCLETASRYLRLFDEILLQGIVSTEDVYIDTTDLPESLPVSSPILFDITTQDAPVLDQHLALVTISTNLLAITNTEEAAFTLFQLRKQIIDANTKDGLFYLYRMRNIYAVSYLKIQEAFSNQFSKKISFHALKNVPSLHILHDLSIMAQDNIPRTLRHALLTDPISLDEMSKNILGDLYYEGLSQDEWMEQAVSILRLSILSEEESCDEKKKALLLINDPRDFLTRFHAILIESYLACAGQYASGDPCTTLALYPSLFCSSLEDSYIKGSGFKYYALDKHFKSKGYRARGEASDLSLWSATRNDELALDDLILKQNAEKLRPDLFHKMFYPPPQRTGYQFNPHAHVKIWLSNHPDSFMNLENKLRLIKMRGTNPTDQITLAFDGQLLTLNSKRNLIDFCERYSIISLDVRDHLLLHHLTLNEKKLLKLYEDEVSHLNHGGNLGAASDILRWFRFIYTQGIYTDLDIDIDTQSLPTTMVIDACMLINMGMRADENQKDEPLVNRLMANMSNDVLAVVDETDALEKIESMQLTLINAYKNPPYNHPIPGLSQEKQSILTNLRKMGRGRSVRELRQYIQLISRDNETFKQAVLGLDGRNKTEIQRALQQLRLEITSGHLDTYISDEALLTMSREAFQAKHLPPLVALISGPIRQGIFPEAHYSESFYYAHIKGYAYQNYARLEAAFQVHHDLSWTPAGLKIALDRDDILRAIAASRNVVIEPELNIPPKLAEILLDEAHQATLIMGQLRGLIATEVDLKNKSNSMLSLLPIGFFNKNYANLSIFCKILNDINAHQYCPNQWGRLCEKVSPCNATQEKIVHYVNQLVRINSIFHENTSGFQRK